MQLHMETFKQCNSATETVADIVLHYLTHANAYNAANQNKLNNKVTEFVGGTAFVTKKE